MVSTSASSSRCCPERSRQVLRPRDYLELEKVAKALARKTGEPWLKIFDNPSVGFVFREESGPHPSEVTPRNTDCFATSAGGHFSFVLVPGRPLEKSPVLMTVPLGTESQNVI